VAEVDIDTWVSTLAVIGAMFALYFTLRRELRDQVDRLEARVDRLEGRVGTLEVRLEGRIASLDDRLYGLAVGLKPVIDEAAARAPKA
jgi:membrane protein implicated in regulation of membrane protease activity